VKGLVERQMLVFYYVSGVKAPALENALVFIKKRSFSGGISHVRGASDHAS